ncbi:MAG: hypothetical protein AAFN79_17730 [Pseudomonadota bacterium]
MHYAPLSTVSVTPSFACYWEGQGDANLAGINDLSLAPAALRGSDPEFEFLCGDDPWRAGAAPTVASACETGPSAAAPQGVGPIIGIREARAAREGELAAQRSLIAQFVERNAPLSAFSPDHVDASGRLGGAAFQRREATLTGALRARLSAGETIRHQGAIWMHGEADAAIARAAGDVDRPAIVDYADGLARIRDFHRAQLGAPRAPWRFVAISEEDVYAAAINDALASLCRWRVSPGGLIEDMGAGRDETSYIIDHLIRPTNGVHFDVTQMRAIGALIWEAHLHHAGPCGLAFDHPIRAIRPAWMRLPAVTRRQADSATLEAAASEDGALYAMAAPAAGRARDAAEIIARGRKCEAKRGEVASVSVNGLASGAIYEMWSVYQAADGEVSDVASTAFISRPAFG